MTTDPEESIALIDQDLFQNTGHTQKHEAQGMMLTAVL